MDIAALSMNISQFNTLNSVGTAMLAKSLDTAESVGNALTNMIDAAAMERSVNPSVGGNIDISI